MDYKKKYENALEWARQVLNGECGFIRKDVEEVFPELKESEEEKIRKTLIDYFKNYKTQEEIGIKTFFGIPTDDILAWLEKQNRDGKKWIYEDVYLKEKEQLIQDGIDEVLENPQKYGLEKQGEPKFKIGQRIKQGNTIAKIKEISKDGYHCDIAFVPFTAEDNWELSLWDENDDKMLYECKKEIWKSAPTMLSLKHEKIERWLESLKERLQ